MKFIPTSIHSPKSRCELAYYFTDNLAGEYMRTMLRYIDRLRRIHEAWRIRWNRIAPKDRPQLAFEQNGETKVTF